ncbi:hypothetical protein M422DRAFT_249596 [Sphaerobolus stellatus SS14]|uniref:Uncharacterized protein n=1 Tax=Sphaerobolus stellatus (strain SS14) TaxID=990650 RepID=A0A0C9W3W8_SPHS4|nr:hypothetical protein M422DRAFT_249596 [Sphaerobolus stellatus SS14]
MPFWKHDANEEEKRNDALDTIKNIDPNATHEHKAKVFHEFIAAAASYEAAKLTRATSRRTASLLAMPKELLAGFAGAFVDYIVESKGLDALDKAKEKHAKHEAEKDAIDALPKDSYH